MPFAKNNKVQPPEYYMCRDVQCLGRKCFIPERMKTPKRIGDGRKYASSAHMRICKTMYENDWSCDGVELPYDTERALYMEIEGWRVVII